MSQPFKLSIIAFGLAVGLAFSGPASAEPAKESKQKKETVAPKTTRADSGQRGTDKYPAGPLYNGQDYVGTDPDPFIRQMLMRDLGARYGGDQ